MKKFLIKCTALALALAAAIYVGGVIFRSTNYWKNRERNEETDKYRNMPETVTFAVFGPSHARDAFRAEDWGEGFFNFAMSSQTPQYDLMLMREFSDKIAPGATVVLTVTHTSLLQKEKEADFAVKQERYYRILSPENIVDCDLARWYLARFSPLLTTDVRDVLGAFLRPEALQPSSDELYGKQTLTQAELPAERERVKRDHLRPEAADLTDRFPQEPAVEEMLSLCRERGWKPVLVIVPYLRLYNECFPDDVREATQDRVRSMAEAYGVPWLDCSQDADFAENFDYFKNIDHLNIAGANAFAAKLQPTLRELGLWE